MKNFLITLSLAACILAVYPAALTSADCLILGGTICFEDKNTYIAKDNLPTDVVGLWTFDDSKGIDSSGLNNHLVSPHTPGPAYGGKGYSAAFNGSTYIQINFTSFTYSHHWNLAIGFPKGKRTFRVYPTLQLWPSENRLHVLVDTNANIKESLDSQGLLVVRRWTHIGLIFSEKLVQIFLNGQLDNQKILEGALVQNTGLFYIGDDPYISGTNCLIDSFTIFNSLKNSEYFMSIQKNTFNLYGSSNFVMLGCSACSYYEAVNSCQDGYHLCSNQELYAGAYWVARINGWFGGRDVWRRAPTVDGSAALSGDMLDPYASK